MSLHPRQQTQLDRYNSTVKKYFIIIQWKTDKKKS